MPNPAPQPIVPVPAPIQLQKSLSTKLVQVDLFIRAKLARDTFEVNGNGLTVAVLDTGLNTTHVDVVGRVPTQRNFTSDNRGDPTNATDGRGHGAHVGGIIVAKGDHVGIAPGAKIIPVKVLDNAKGSGSFQQIVDGLQWVIDNQATFNITAVNMSLGNDENYPDDDFGINPIVMNIRSKIITLNAMNVAVVISAGNAYFTFNPNTAPPGTIAKQGMGFPAILRECISVGAVYDAKGGPFLDYISGAKAFSAKAGQITPFSQRLHPSKNPDSATTIFAPGAPTLSTGILGNHGGATDHGTSMAAPVIAGIVLLMQELHLRLTGTLPTVAQLKTWLRQGDVAIMDGDDEHDNVLHTGLEYGRVDAMLVLDAVQRDATTMLIQNSAAFQANAEGQLVQIAAD